MTEFAFISLGSNINPETNLPMAIKALSDAGELMGVSKAYQNPAIGPAPQADFINAAALLLTELPAQELRQHLRRIEAELGRVRTTDKYAPRTIDLDLCLLGRQVHDTPELQIPDPGILKHPHLAIPLAELMPSFHHPALGAALGDIADRLRTGATLSPREDLQLTPRRHTV
ncbi:MAG: 2-amino-4-hydroxy-6-hydroxymethyldihydropteridine diphosphokinase [Anaerolineales bacterium]|nr:2-amino-4-hydroxy-6-hydroxymethyldihydropteridine diphosphokinase [Anaerolineales bacterium]